MKKYITIILILLATFSLVACSSDKDNSNVSPIEDDKDNDEKIEEVATIVDGTKTLNGNELWLIRNEQATSNFKLNENDDLVLVDNTSGASFESTALEVSNFNELVLSWNLRNLADGTVVYLFALGDGTNFSDFQPIASFKDENNRSLLVSENGFFDLSIDTIINKDFENNKYIKLKLNIMPQANNQVIIKNISVTTRVKGKALSFDETKLLNKKIDVSPLQQLSVPLIGNLICSPTSLVMVINYYGYDYDQELMAKKVQDNRNKIYGNWTLNVSYAGSHEGIYSRVEHITDFNKVIDYINNDIPLVLSIKTTSKDQLKGSIMAYGSGHLIVLIGFEEIDGKWYGLVNDPAEHENGKVSRKYDLDQIINVWNGYTYVVSDKNIFK